MISALQTLCCVEVGAERHTLCEVVPVVAAERWAESGWVVVAAGRQASTSRDPMRVVVAGDLSKCYRDLARVSV